LLWEATGSIAGAFVRIHLQIFKESFLLGMVGFRLKMLLMDGSTLAVGVSVEWMVLNAWAGY